MEEFESVVLSCGHSITSHAGLGVCNKCRRKVCGKCLQLIDEKNLCPKCFEEFIGDKNE
ncbi:hypothetical protein [Candidatus Nitrosotenuis sp. DW1]|uniref:hypothetical protein n=1 Tax=Candidatus Nitrosotenuis sp. DW1 TaxID=2259672 RepID=UPI0015C9456C|nr:hypothetical protein [Candidatus Nitrosotenuis sp. DW1]